MKTRVLFVVGALLIALPGLVGARDMQPLVSVDWLDQHLGEDNLVVVDVRSAIDGSSQSDFEEAHIPGAVYASYTEAGWRQDSDGVPGKLPAEDDLAELIGGLGIDNDTDVVIVPAGVGSTDFGSAARVYWTFKVLGHDRVSILNGGHKAWVEAGKSVESGWNEPEPRSFAVNFRPELIASSDDVSNAPNAGIQLVDNRPADQFLGRDKHPASRAAGTIPGSLNLEQQKLTHEGTSFMVDEETVRQLMEQAQVNSDQRSITFCNTGHWAAMGWFAMSEIAGQTDVAMYDGSMVEWSQDENRPLQTERRGLGGLIDRFLN
ncbi:thiosulfate/3-mercaptopyruvate sulfurtransferase [Natronocella acetinitrilica]|uniref:Thiosulfate/3-mercaptopyruvate sulfurtransferase n=1 Tax=Natronocella acetinitrilica TaxID=414046 RepID=A0AAE3G6V5_9GAMM|nr:sulfurtransferase [Natronocella acetinitrilica]MCP1676517.1 thiosulfate/3-mercaptopyruvate sulfurtransferase [Natronocella acetinitrilica]